eukprot:CAMPEP_0201694126 /NCGR_PEP_ID=MMETSP0578-20130828/6492_1 /ASSEMBLY_ACC=CAM_ASM_000663 /TAXON_ID=267565 /ORGANISM="Skeletonema grethea, Strain CCMP 1804" /LENGTH=502 /DNA_ID=CAMNT_0048179759 /DNA_START=201 /DNA_END=1706 /DNA_ORIENTATION=+
MSPTTQSQLTNDDDDDDNYYNPQDGSSPTTNNLFHNLSSDENDDKKSRIKLRYIIPMLTRILTAILAISLIGVVFCVLPYFAVEAGKKGHINQTLYWIAGCFVLITVPISVLGIVQHLVNWYMPQVQKFVVRILFMVPIFSIQSWFSLFFLSAAPYLTAVRELYEAFVLSSFVYYIIELCGGEDQLANKLRMKDPKFGQHTTCLVRSQCGIWQMGRPFLLNCKYGVLQFVFFKIVGTIVVIVLHSQDSFHQGEWGWNSSYTYLAIIMNVSIAYALYCLVTLYFATKDDLKEWNPVWKFICIKGIIFATFWQHFLIQVLYSVGVIKGFGDWDASMAADGLPAFLICIEMLGFAVAHLYAFPHTDYLHYLQRHDQSFNNTTSLLRSPFRGRRMGRGNDNNSETLFLFDQDNNVVNDSSIDTEYQPPTFRQLDRPMSVSRALVSTVNPSETLSDISRMAGSVVVGGEGTSAGRGGNGERGGGSRRGNSPLTDGEVIFSLDQAEGI